MVSKRQITSRRPLEHARDSAVSLFLSETLSMSALCCNNTSQTSTCPAALARISGVNPTCQIHTSESLHGKKKVHRMFETRLAKSQLYTSNACITLVHRSLSGNIVTYLADDCHLVANARQRRLRSTDSRTCIVNRTHSTFADRAFAAAGIGLWNSLPPYLRDADLPYSRFRQSLTTFLFGYRAHGSVRTILTVPSRNNLTYLLTYLLI